MDSRTLPTLGEALVRVLCFFDYQRLYGVGGDYAAGLIGALEREAAILPASNELHAACAQAELEGLGFCLTTFTVGILSSRRRLGAWTTTLPCGPSPRSAFAPSACRAPAAPVSPGSR